MTKKILMFLLACRPLWVVDVGIKPQKTLSKNGIFRGGRTFLAPDSDACDWPRCKGLNYFMEKTPNFSHTAFGNKRDV